MNLIIIEGPDRAGKSTLIKNLCNQADNCILRHFGKAIGDTDLEKRNFQYQFFKKEFQMASERNKFEMPDKQRYPRDVYIFDRSHIGEFVYGNLYRKTHPEQWVMRMETDFSFDIDPSIYLILLTAPAEFLCKREDGQSFSSDVQQKEREFGFFKGAFEESKIMNKLMVNVSDGENYRDKLEILEEVNNFIWKKT